MQNRLLTNSQDDFFHPRSFPPSSLRHCEEAATGDRGLPSTSGCQCLKGYLTYTLVHKPGSGHIPKASALIQYVVTVAAQATPFCALDLAPATLPPTVPRTVMVPSVPAWHAPARRIMPQMIRAMDEHLHRPQLGKHFIGRNSGYIGPSFK